MSGSLLLFCLLCLKLYVDLSTKTAQMLWSNVDLTCDLFASVFVKMDKGRGQGKKEMRKTIVACKIKGQGCLYFLCY